MLPFLRIMLRPGADIDAPGAGVMGIGVLIPVVQGPVGLAAIGIRLPFCHTPCIDFLLLSLWNGVGRALAGALFTLFTKGFQIKFNGAVRL